LRVYTKKYANKWEMGDVFSFKKEGKLFIMDYGTPYEEITGVHGPYDSLDEYKKFYPPEKRQVEGLDAYPEISVRNICEGGNDDYRFSYPLFT
jgi:hypothetical protein